MVMAQIYTNCGEYEKALDELENLLSLESLVTANSLKFEYWTRPLRELPRYRELEKKYAL